MATKNKSRKRRSSADQVYIEEMRVFSHLCITILVERVGDIRSAAAECGLSHTTVYRLWNSESEYPRFDTIQKLSKAAGLYILTDSRGKVRLRVAS